MIWRIRQRRTFQSVVRSGRRTRTKSLWCSYLNDHEAAPLRVAFSVGRPVGTATRRNRLKRRLRAIVAEVAAPAGMTHGWLLVGAHPCASELTFRQLRSEMKSLLHEAVTTE